MLTSIPNVIRSTLRSSENCALVVLVVTGFIVSGALKFDVVFGFDPCSLCLSQRLFFLLAGLTSGVALIHKPHSIVYPIISGLWLLGGAIIAIQHNWLLWGPVDSSSCGPDVLYLIDFDYPIADILRALLVGSVSCAEDTHKPFAAGAVIAFAGLLYVVVGHVRTCIKDRR